MAKKQSRRTVSFNRAIYEAITQAAESTGLSCSEWLTQLVRSVIPDLPDTVHARPGRIAEPKVKTPRAPQPNTECECGNTKSPKEPACARCVYLDGREVGREALVISALRGTDGMSLREICQAFGGNEDYANGQRSMRRVIDSLLAQKRIRRYWREADSSLTYKRRQHIGGRDAVVKFGGDGAWVYALDGATEKEWAA